MKYSLRKSFSYRRRKDIHDDDHVNPRHDNHVSSNSNSNLMKTNQSKNFLRRRRRYSSSPPHSASPSRTTFKTSELPYNNHINDEDDDDDPFSPSTNTNTRVRPFDKLTYQIRKSFRNTLTRRSRIESTNSNKRLIINKNDENRPVNPVDTSISTGLTSTITSLSDTVLSNENNKAKAPPKRRKAPLAPTHMNQSVSVPNPTCSSLRINDLQESGYVSSSNDQQQQDLFNKKNKLNRSFRSRISLLLKKRHAKQQQQQQQQQIPNSTDEEPDHQHPDDHDENNNKKQTLSQRFDTIRRSFHFVGRNSSSKGKRHLLSNE